MLKFKYVIQAEGENGPVTIHDIAEGAWAPAKTGKARVLRFNAVSEIPDAKITEVRAELTVKTANDEFIFMNGYQAWSYCPEYDRNGVMHGIRLPKAISDHFGVDRYGDYYFKEYPAKPGYLHGTSYCYFRRGKVFRLLASLDETPGYTQFFYEAERNRLTLCRDAAGLRVNGKFHAFDLFLAEGSEEEVFDAWFEALGIRNDPPAMAGYSSWYNRYEDISERSILSDLSGAEGLLKPGDLFQIDDGWEPAVGDWLEADPKKFPGGMKAQADAIHEKGFLAGLWLAPFVACKKSAVFKEHPDWFYKHDGEPWFAGMNWGGFYALDFDHPEVRAYLTETFRQVFDDWGFDLVKLDFLYAGAPYGDEKETRAGRMIRAMEFLRELCRDKLIIGCGVPLFPAFGRVDYCRISSDVGLDWDDNFLMQRANRERVSTKHAILNAIFRRELDGRAFGSDPDVFFLRDKNLKLTAAQKELLAVNAALFGTMHLNSDDFGTYSDDKKETFRSLMALASEATDVQVSHEKDENGKPRLTVSYRLGGEERSYEVPLR